jgi:anti-anti-sigma factor
MEITTSIEHGRVPVTVVHVTGNLDSYTANIFQVEAEELIKGGARHILVDLTQVPFVSSAGFRVLNYIFNQLRTLHPDSNLSENDVRKGVSAGTYSSPHLKLLNLSKEAKHAFEMAGFDMYIEAFTDYKTAVAAF